jgi:DNA mismatch repair ATPase MutS
MALLELLQTSDVCFFFIGRINIITGPNYSGKSIYIKQVIDF